MVLTTDPSTIDLVRNQVARLTHVRGTRLRCTDGVAWVTIDGDLRDVVLERGQSFVVDSRAGVVVQALGGPASVAVEHPALTPVPSRRERVGYRLLQRG